MALRGLAWVVCASGVLLVSCADTPGKPRFDGEDSGKPDALVRDGRVPSDGPCECGAHGQCAENGTSCVCDPGYTGTACDAPQSTCYDILLDNADAESGVYTVDPDGSGAMTPFNVYCDMLTDNGGWTKILQYANAAYTPAAGASGDITTSGTPAFAKLSDAQINALAGNRNIYRMIGSRTPQRFYVQPPDGHIFSDAARAWGMTATGALKACEALDFSACTLAAVEAPNFTLDTRGIPGNTAVNDCSRYFVDYPWPTPENLVPNCYGVDAVKRCVNTGIDCTPSHAMVENFSLWVREVRIS